MFRYILFFFVLIICSIIISQINAQGILLDDFDDTSETYSIRNYNNWQEWDYGNSYSPNILYDSIKGNNVMCGHRWMRNIDRSYMALKKYPFFSFKNSFHFFQISFNLIKRSDLFLRNWATYAYFGTSFGVECEDDSLRKIHFKISGWSNQYIDGSVDIPEPNNGPVWYDLRLELDWRKINETEKFGFATLKYKQSKSLDWAIDQNYNGLLLNYNSIPSATYYGIRIKTNSYFNSYYNYQNGAKFYYNSVDDIRYFGIYWDNTEFGEQTQFSLADPSIVSSITWDYGDGTKSTEKEPKHTFNTLGDHPIEVIITYTDGITDTYNFVVQISTDAKADFNVNIGGGCDSVNVSFSDKSTGATSWLWDFGNGQTSVEQNPTVHYLEPGNYSVKLVINEGADSIIKNDFIEVLHSSTVTFKADQTYGGYVPFNVNFINYSSHATDYSWWFGDNSVSTLNKDTIQHEYKEFGVYNVALIAYNGFCGDTLFKDSLIRIIEPEVQIAADVTNGDTPLAVNFKLLESSIDPIIQYKWDFGDGFISTDKNPKHIYTTEGDFNVTVTTTTSNKYTFTTTAKRFIHCKPGQFSSPPVVLHPVPDQIAKINAAFFYYISDSTVNDSDMNDSLRFSLVKSDGQRTPQWINFNDETLSIEAVPPQSAAGMYKLRLKAMDNYENTCFCDFNLWVTNNYTITGRVTGEDAPLNKGKAYLFDRDNFIHACSNIKEGKFEFFHIDSADYSIFIIPDNNEFFLPTYYINKSCWENANFINVYGNVSDLDVQLTPIASSTSGNNYLQGKLILNDIELYPCDNIELNRYDSCPFDLCPVLLLNEIFVPVQWVMPDEDGHFAFSNLNQGKYYIQLQKPGPSNNNIYDVNLKEAFLGEEINISATSILLNYELQAHNLTIYPNPCNNFINIKFGTVSNGQVIIELFNEYGIKLYHKRHTLQSLNQINTSKYKKGIYLLRIQTQTENFLYKIILQ